MIKLKLIGIFVCFLISWWIYYYIDRKPDSSYEIRLQSTKAILSPPRYYTATELKKGKEYKIISKGE